MARFSRLELLKTRIELGLPVFYHKESSGVWLSAGAACVGLESKSIFANQLAAGDADAITENVADVLTWIKQIREC